MSIEYRVKFGNPEGVADVAAQARAATIKAIAEAALERVRDRVRHPAARSLSVSGVNQWAADISGPRGGPGIIRPVRAKALRFAPKGSGRVVFAKYVRGKGLGPLIEAETQRVQSSEVDTDDIRIK